MSNTKQIEPLIAQLYGDEEGVEVTRRVGELLDEYRVRLPHRPSKALSEKDALLITYPDQVSTPGERPLATLSDFAAERLHGLISTIHLLPFYPWSSDDGFSVTDFRAVATRYGSWDDVSRLGRGFGLMFDAEINHASAQSEWFQHFLRGMAPYGDYFVRMDNQSGLKAVTRPRTTSLITRVQASGADVGVWTTFGPDQVDLNYRSPALLLEILDVLLYYVQRGATFLRLDAVPYLWKELGTSCVNLPQTHLIVQIMRAALDEVTPNVRLVAEANMPQVESLRYFGGRHNEVQLIYNFPLAPLMLYAILAEDAGALARWLSSWSTPAPHNAFLNVLATHDGIGLNAAQGLLDETAIQSLVRQAARRGGLISERENSDGSRAPYELNMNYLDALGAMTPDLAPALELERFSMVHAVMLSLQGIPALYFHSLFGSRGWPEGLISSGRKRSINREKLNRGRLDADLADSSSWRARVFSRLGRLLRVRASQPAFAPGSDQRVLVSPRSVLALIRGNADIRQRIMCLYNVSPRAASHRVHEHDLTMEPPRDLWDLVTARRVRVGEDWTIQMEPYQALWLALDEQER